MRRNEIRYDALADRRVIFSPGRSKRPRHSARCVFCPDALPGQRVIRRIGGRRWKAAIVENGFPAVTPDNPKARGRHELIIETPRHAERFEDLSASRMAWLLGVYADRLKVLRKDPRVKYVIIFKNSGPAAGASQPHAHSQVLALDFVTRQARGRRRPSCLECAEDAVEEKGPRLIWRDRRMIAFAPRVSMFPYEAVIRPRRHLDNLTQLTGAERLSMAKVLKRIVATLKRLGIEYNFYMHDIVDDDGQHLELRVTPHAEIWGGLEFATGSTINTTLPEDAAKAYRRGLI